jgi:acylglycerol lipase
MNAPDARSWDIGTGVHGYVWESSNPRAVLLLQHGYAEYAERFVARYHGLIPRLVQHGITVYAIDMRGHGRSPGVRFAPDVRQAVRDHIAARRILEMQPLPLFLLGHSLGGLVTATSVARDPRGLRGVILSSPLLIAKSNAPLRFVARILAAIAPGVIVRRGHGKGLSRIAEEMELAQADPLMRTDGVTARVGITSLALIAENWPRFAQWQTPVLVIHGTADTATDPEGSRRFVETIRAADKTLRMFEGGYHELLNDLDRDEAMQLILGWLDARV